MTLEWSKGGLDLRTDLDPQSYAEHAADWLSAGATVVGGCCGTRPSHIAALRALIDNPAYSEDTVIHSPT